MKINDKTRISPHLARVWNMLNILFVIQSLERKVMNLESNISRCKGRDRKHMISCYEEAINIFRIKIRQEEGNYNLLLNQLVAETLYTPDPIVIHKKEIPEQRIIDHDDDIESHFHRKNCGAH